MVPASRGVGFGLAIACVAVVPAWEYLQPRELAKLPATHALLRSAPHEWLRAAESGIAEWNPVFRGADRIERAEFVNSKGELVEVFVASYEAQRQNKELVNYANAIIGPQDGEIVSSASAPSGGVARELIIQGPHQRSLIRYFYDIGGFRTERGIVAQLRYGVKAMWREPVSSVVALRAVCASDCDAARAVLDGFAASVDAH
jgi:EpsI family protein